MMLDLTKPRRMSDAEREAWAFALWLATFHGRDGGRDRAYDRLCQEANDAERKSIRCEQRGDAEGADGWIAWAEIHDAAARGLVR